MSTGVILTNWERVDRIKIESELAAQISAANTLIEAGINDQAALKKARLLHLSLENAANSQAVCEQLEMEAYFEMLITIADVNQKLNSQIRLSSDRISLTEDDDELDVPDDNPTLDEVYLASKADIIADKKVAEPGNSGSVVDVDYLSDGEIEEHFNALIRELDAAGLMPEENEGVPELKASRESVASFIDYSEFEDLDYDDEESVASAESTEEDFEATFAALEKELKAAGLLAEEVEESLVTASFKDDSTVVDNRVEAIPVAKAEGQYVEVPLVINTDGKALGATVNNDYGNIPGSKPMTFAEISVALDTIYKEARTGDLVKMSACLDKLSKLYTNIFSDDMAIGEERYKLADKVFDTYKEIRAHCRYLSRSIDEVNVVVNANSLQRFARRYVPSRFVPNIFRDVIYGIDTTTHSIDVEKGTAIRDCLIRLEAHALSFADDYAIAHRDFWEAKTGKKQEPSTNFVDKFRCLASKDANSAPEYKKFSVEALIETINKVLPPVEIATASKEVVDSYTPPVQFTGMSEVKTASKVESTVLTDSNDDHLKALDELLEEFGVGKLNA